MYLMKSRWWTDETLTSDADGNVKLRGFKGDYTMTLGDDSANSPVELQLTGDQKLKMTL